MKPLIIEPGTLRPLPEGLRGSSCVVCDKRQAMWERSSPEVRVPSKRIECVCSICWLYESEWGKGQRGAIDAFVEAVEKELGRPFGRFEDGRLLLSVDADRIVATVVSTSYRFSMGKVVREGEDDEV
jgi:hypothetical protein